MGGSSQPSGPMIQPQYPDMIPSGGYPPGMIPYNGDWRPGMPGGPGSPNMGFYPLNPGQTLDGSNPMQFDPTQFNFDSEMWGGPYGAPLTTMQLDSMGAMERMLGANPLAQTQDIQMAIQQALGGGQQPGFGPSDLSPFQQQFGDIMGGLQGQMPQFTDIASLFGQGQDLYGGIPQAGAEGADLIRNATGLSSGSQAIFDQTIPAFGELLAGPSFDTTEMFASGEQAFQGDLERAMAQAREEFSALGLDPGSTDRAEGLARTGATESARFRTGQQQQAMQAFENAQQRRLAAAGLAPGLSAAFENPQDRALQAGSILSQLGLQGAGMQSDILSQLTGMSQIPFGEQLAANQQGLQGSGIQASMLPTLLQSLQTEFGQNMGLSQLGLQGQQVGAGMLPSLMQAFNNPAMLAGQAFDMGTVGQQTADQQIQRMMQEFGRTQNAMLPAFMSLISGSPMQQASYGPSTISQIGSFLGGLGQFGGAAYDWWNRRQ